jgi:hypothetical protein
MKLSFRTFQTLSHFQDCRIIQIYVISAEEVWEKVF